MVPVPEEMINPTAVDAFTSDRENRLTPPVDVRPKSLRPPFSEPGTEGCCGGSRR